MREHLVHDQVFGRGKPNLRFPDRHVGRPANGLLLVGTVREDKIHPTVRHRILTGQYHGLLCKRLRIYKWGEWELCRQREKIRDSIHFYAQRASMSRVNRGSPYIRTAWPPIIM